VKLIALPVMRDWRASFGKAHFVLAPGTLITGR
jgi:hypothetical protein